MGFWPGDENTHLSDDTVCDLWPSAHSGLVTKCRTAYKSLLDGVRHQWQHHSIILRFYNSKNHNKLSYWHDIFICNDLREFSRICKSAALTVMAPVIGYSVCVCVSSYWLKTGAASKCIAGIRLRDTGEIP